MSDREPADPSGQAGQAKEEKPASCLGLTEITATSYIYNR